MQILFVTTFRNPVAAIVSIKFLQKTVLMTLKTCSNSRLLQIGSLILISATRGGSHKAQFGENL